MPAVIRWCPCGCRASGSIRLGPECSAWHKPYTHSLSFEMAGAIAVIGGLDWIIEDFENRWVIEAFCDLGIYPAIERVGHFDDAGDPVMRARLLPIPRKYESLRRNRPASLQGLITKEGTFMRKPNHASLAKTDTAEDRKATADELRHVADLVEHGHLHIRNSSEVALADGWDRMQFDRKVNVPA